jgi:hypothetical protein
VATVPGLVIGGVCKFDPRFYLLFWALELPDIQAQGQDPYTTFQSDLQASLSASKVKLQTVTLDMKRSAAESDRRRLPAPGRHAGPSMTANEKPIVTQQDVDQAENVMLGYQAKLRLLPDEREEYTARSQHWLAFFEARTADFRMLPGNKSFTIFVQVRPFVMGAPRHVQSSATACAMRCAAQILHHGRRGALQECIMPRCLFSMEDAMFCARFISMLEECEVPGYLHATAMDLICQTAVPVIRCCTDQEASNLIVFMKEVQHPHQCLAASVDGLCGAVLASLNVASAVVGSADASRWSEGFTGQRAPQTTTRRRALVDFCPRGKDAKARVARYQGGGDR